ncbi:DUF721 domain-containing protein [Sideroxydans lithotrophicus]|uniref:DUF721 domain-containing protein n=1 Tax=Sideroxydans lithotrophicus (strain ES-1) TaxID=580332 RepID=D5CP14_SIDLE|nr:protein of unknown function DUF721 [Sideroxydans lithotrophicus ES-1]
MPHRLNSFLASNQELRLLSSKATLLRALQRHYESFAPPDLARNSQVSRMNHQTLVLVANNGAVAAKLRHMTTELISLFQARGCEVTGIQIRVQVSIPSRPAPPKPRQLGKVAREALQKLDANLGDSSLKAALRRLARKA